MHSQQLTKEIRQEERKCKLFFDYFSSDCAFDKNKKTNEVKKKNHELAATYISVPVRESIIGDEELSFQVRNGTGRFLFSIATRIVN